MDERPRWQQNLRFRFNLKKRGTRAGQFFSEKQDFSLLRRRRAESRADALARLAAAPRRGEQSVFSLGGPARAARRAADEALAPRHAPRHAKLRGAHARSAGAPHPASTRTAVRRIDANAAVILVSTSDDETKDESPSRRLVVGGDARRGHSNARRSARLARNSGAPRLAPPLSGRRRAYYNWLS